MFSAWYGLWSFTDIYRRRTFDKVLRDKAFNIAKNPRYDGYQRGLASMVYKFFDKKSLDEKVVNEIISNKELAEKLHNSMVRKYERRNVHPSFIDNIWGTDLADMELTSKFNKGFRFSLYFIDICSQYAWVLPLKDKKGNTNTNAFQKI